jgi:hypothetical protein
MVHPITPLVQTKAPLSERERASAIVLDAIADETGQRDGIAILGGRRFIVSG